jgi:polyketide biosynthesis enoyl-CoA hydratase PksI
MSQVVHLAYPDPRIAVVEMADRENSNQFTRALVEELAECVAQAQRNPDARVVVVHGYGSIFCTGGTRDELLGIFDGHIRFDDVPLYRLFLDCELPVISAMQGHALGGGLILGLFADLVILAEESLYSANFMKYGFTPGMGSTLVLPEKLGPALAAEMLFTARGYHGGELARRGVPFPVMKRNEVAPAALRMAGELAGKPLASLKLLKRRLIESLAARLPAAVQAELEMHKISFAQPEIRERIQNLFGT